jgi:hypothetical protein
MLDSYCVVRIHNVICTSAINRKRKVLLILTLLPSLIYVIKIGETGGGVSPPSWRKLERGRLDQERRIVMPLLPLYSFEIMQKELFALHKEIESLGNKIPEDDLKRMNEHLEKIKKEIQGAR